MAKTLALRFIPNCPIGDLKPFGRYPRKNDQAVEAVARSIKQFGFNQPIVVNEKMQVCAGHTRLKAAQLLNLKTVPVVVAPGLKGSKFTGYNIADNQTASLADWNFPELEGLLKELKADDFDLSTLGFDDDELRKLLGEDEKSGATDEDHVPEAPKVPITNPGDLWLLGDHRLLCGDSTKEDAVKRLMGDARAGLMNTDPPYGVGYDVQQTYDAANQRDGGHRQSTYDSIDNDDKSGEELQSFLESCIRTARPYLTDTCAFYLWHPMLTQGTFFAAAAADILIHRQIIWIKPHFIFGRGDYHWQHELCFYGWVRGNRPNWFGERNQSTIWAVGSDRDKQHPTQKPVELFAIPIRNHTRPGDVVYEPFSGSGSQIIAAEKLGRRCYAIEIEPRYCDVAVKRWEEFTGRKATRE